MTRDRPPAKLLAEAPEELELELELEVAVLVELLSSVDVAVLVDLEEEAVVVELEKLEMPLTPALPVAEEPPEVTVVARVMGPPPPVAVAVRAEDWATAARGETARRARTVSCLKEYILTECGTDEGVDEKVVRVFVRKY